MQVLNLAAAKLDVVITEPVADRLLVFARQLQHRRIEIDADHFALGADDLGDDVASLAAAGAQIENRLAFVNITRRIAAAVVFLDDFVRE